MILVRSCPSSAGRSAERDLDSIKADETGSASALYCWPSDLSPYATFEAIFEDRQPDKPYTSARSRRHVPANAAARRPRHPRGRDLRDLSTRDDTVPGP